MMKHTLSNPLLQASLRSDQSDKIAKLKSELGHSTLGNWNWDILDSWANKIQDLEAKKRVLTSIEAFKKWEN